ncbi:MAG: mobile mystery protein A [Gemmatimonadota bacterium]|nr:mobile mystery protein A [Gemmatimonadota bacterium]
MARPRKIAPDFLALQRRQLDAKLEHAQTLEHLVPPTKGWIRTIREALGMTADQLGRRLHMTKQGVLDLERREVDATISLGTLRKAADALNVDVVVALIPRKSLEVTIHEQAESKAIHERNRVVHTMRLESQDAGTEDELDRRKNIDSWLTTRIARLWD